MVLTTRVDPISYSTVTAAVRTAGVVFKFGRKKRVSKVILLTFVLIVCIMMNKMYRVVPVLN